MKSLNKHYLLSVLYFSSLILFIVGITSPILTISQLWFIDHSFSILSAITQLLFDGHWFIFFFVAGFSLVLPLFKLVLLYRLIHHQQRTTKTQYWLQLMHQYGRWSLLDVMVIAILIVSVKLGAIASVEIHYGLYIFTSAIILIMVVTHLIHQRATTV